MSNSSFSCGPTSSFTDCVKIYDSGSPSSISVEIQNHGMFNDEAKVFDVDF